MDLFRRVRRGARDGRAGRLGDSGGDRGTGGGGRLLPATIPVRPGETAKLSLEIYGPCENPTFAFRKFFGLSTTACAFETSVAKDEKLVCRNGIDWRVEKAADGALVKEGRLAEPLPQLSGSKPFAFTAKVPEDGVCVVDLMKCYVP